MDHSGPGDFLLFISAAGECAIAFVIYWEWENGRVDKFFEDVDQKQEDREEIYRAYCGLVVSGGTPRNELFRDHILDPNNSKLKHSCDDNVRLLSRIGARLPMFQALRRRVVEWHVVVLLWEIMGPYVEQRRDEAGPSFARSFLEYALASVDNLLEQKRDKWTIKDPDLSRKQDVILTRTRLVELRSNLLKHLSES